MADKEAPLWLHAYSGKENGLMVVGTPPSLKALGQQLVEASVKQSAAEATSWPISIAKLEVTGPYSDVAEYSLSFHLQGNSSLSEVIPHGRRGPSTFTFLALGFCAVVGAFTIARWALSYVL